MIEQTNHQPTHKFTEIQQIEILNAVNEFRGAAGPSVETIARLTEFYIAFLASFYDEEVNPMNLDCMNITKWYFEEMSQSYRVLITLLKDIDLAILNNQK